MLPSPAFPKHIINLPHNSVGPLNRSGNQRLRPRDWLRFQRGLGAWASGLPEKRKIRPSAAYGVNLWFPFGIRATPPLRYTLPDEEPVSGKVFRTMTAKYERTGKRVF